MAISTLDCEFMSQAIELAEQGRGAVEPNPQVGCLIVSEGKVIGRGYHQRFGDAHAEVNALADAGEAAQGADVYVTLEPCCHQGKTGPCTQALIQAGVSRVVVGCEDPNPKVAGQGITRLRAAGIDVSVDVLNEQARQLIAPFIKLVTTGRPWVIAKWAMTLDGKIATHTGSSQWISGEASRAIVHQIRGQVDGILVGRGTVEADNPLLTARPAGPRTATRIVLDSTASLSSDSKLIQSVDQAPLLVVSSTTATPDNLRRLQNHGVELHTVSANDRADQIGELLDELGRRQMTNLLVEGGSEVLGALFDLEAIDEVHVFVAPKLIGGGLASGPIGGLGLAEMTSAKSLKQVQIETLDNDLHIHGCL